MSLEITGKLLQKLPMQSGQGSTGNSWQKQEFIIETTEQYPKKICAQLWGDKIDQLEKLNIGEMISVSFAVESREYNGKWYTDVKAWRVNTVSPEKPKNTPVKTEEEQEYLTTFTDESQNDDLPF